MSQNNTNILQNISTLTLNGDVSGTNSAINVSKIQNKSIESISPNDADILMYNNSLNKWQYTNSGALVVDITFFTFPYTIQTNDTYLMPINPPPLNPPDWSLYRVTLPTSSSVGRTVCLMGGMELRWNGTTLVSGVLCGYYAYVNGTSPRWYHI